MSKQVNTKVTVNNEVVNEAINKVEALVVKREKWESRILVRSNKVLYGLLGEIYALYKEMEAGNYVKEALKIMKEKLAERGMGVQANSSALTVLIRYVFDCDRQRAYNYAQALKAAAAAETAAEEVADFIASKGVEALKQGQVKKAETIAHEQQLADAEEIVRKQLEDMHGLATVKLAQEEVTFMGETKLAFLVARQVAGGEFEVLRAVSKTTLGMERMMLKALASEVVAQQAQQTLVDNSDLSGSARDSSGQASKLDEAMKAARAGLTRIETLTSSNDELADVAA